MKTKVFLEKGIIKTTNGEIGLVADQNDEI